MSFDSFYAKYKDKYSDIDGVAGVQCVDLAKAWFKEEDNIPYFSFGGSAKNIWENFESFPQLTKIYKKIPLTADLVPQKEDICVWNGKYGQGNGHIAIGMGEGEAGQYFYSFDQNWTYKYAHKQRHTFDGLYGVLRRKSAIIETPTKVVTETPKVAYYAQYKGKSKSLVDALKEMKIDSSFSNRKKIAKANNISGYIGTASQNTQILILLKRGKCVKA